MRLPRATRALASATTRDPLAVRVGAAGAVEVTGGVRVTGAPSTQKPGPSEKVRVRPARSSRTTTCMPPDFSTRVTAPTHPDMTSSTTRPRSAATGREVGRRAEGWGPEARTSWE